MELNEFEQTLSRLECEGNTEELFILLQRNSELVLQLNRKAGAPGEQFKKDHGHNHEKLDQWMEGIKKDLPK